MKHTIIYLFCGILFIISIFGIVFFYSSDLSVTSLVVFDDIVPRNETFSYERPDAVSVDTALNALLKAEDDINDLSSLEININLASDTLLQAKRFFIGRDFSLFLKETEHITDPIKKSYLKDLTNVYGETPVFERVEKDYNEVHRLTAFIDFHRTRAYVLYDSFTLLKEKEEKARKEGIDTTDGVYLLDLTWKAFSEERFEEAFDLLDQADTSLDDLSAEADRKEKIDSLRKNFFGRYWWQILLFVVIIGVLFTTVMRKVQLNISQRRLRTLRLELESLQNLLKKAQHDCFVKKSITEGTYKILVDTYSSRIAEIKHTIPVLEAHVKRGRK